MLVRAELHGNSGQRNAEPGGHEWKKGLRANIAAVVPRARYDFPPAANRSKRWDGPAAQAGPGMIHAGLNAVENQGHAIPAADRGGKIRPGSCGDEGGLAFQYMVTDMLSARGGA